MAKTAQKEKSTTTDNQPKKAKSAPSDNENHKQHKKQAKQEAKTMLKLEAAKRDEQKAEQKVIKAQTKLVASRMHVQALEEKLAQVRSSQQSSHADASKSGFALQQELPDLNGHAQDSTQDLNDVQENNAQAPSMPSASSEPLEPTSPPDNQLDELPPVDGHTDNGQDEESAASHDEGNAMTHSSDEEVNP